MENIKLSYKEFSLLRAAVSFLRTNIQEAEEHLDIEISEKEVDDLEAKIYQGNADAAYVELKLGKRRTKIR